MEKSWPLVNAVSRDPFHSERASALPPPTTEGIKAWPQETHKLEEHHKEWSVIIYDTILILLPLGLLAKAILITIFGPLKSGGLDTVSTATIHLVEFDSQLVTLFTIVFTTIIATLVRRYALWKAQKGASVAELEQLHSSISLPKSLSLIWSLRSWTLTSVALVLMWSWSVFYSTIDKDSNRYRYYLGSQAVSRELRFFDSGAAYNLSITYANPSQPSIFERNMPSSVELATMSAKFMPSFSFETSRNPIFQTGYDYLGNLFIPTRSYQFNKSYGYLTKFDKGSWWKTELLTKETWSSFLGMELTASYNQPEWSGTGPKNLCYNCDFVTNKVIGEVTITTSYIQPNCSFAQLSDKSSFLGLLPFVNTVLNMTNATIPTIQISELWNNNSTIISTCNLTETKVELEILCSAQGCKSSKERAMPGQQLSSSIFHNRTAASMFLNGLILSGGTPASNKTSDAAIIDSLIGHENSLFDDSKATLINPADDRNAAIKRAEHAGSTSETLSRLLNGYLAVSQQALMNTTKNHLVDVLHGIVSDPSFIVVHMKGAPYQPQYRLDWIWMTLDYIGCVVLLVAASTAVWLRKHTLAPDIFGYVSSLTRDNHMINLPEGGSTLNGIDRARMLKGVKVKIADIGGNDGLGRVGLAMKNSSQENVAELRKGKQYM
jgi:hypothetical protein